MNPENHIDHIDVFAHRFQAGNEEAFSYFFHLYYRCIYFFAFKWIRDEESAKDIASAAFIKTWQKREKLQTATAIKSYLYQVTRNDCYKWLHRHKKETSLHLSLAAVAEPVEQSHLPLFIQSEIITQLHRHIRELPKAQRSIFRKLYIEGKTVAETAKELDLHVSTVKTQKQRGILLLRKKLLPLR